MTALTPLGNEIITAMMEPGFYPEACRNVEYRQTHISNVFLAGDYVYKLKKPVRFSFVDYSTVEHRFHYCQEEVRLNRRLAPEVYLGVYPLKRAGRRVALKPEAAGRFDPMALDYVVKMRRLPDAKALERLVRERQVSSTEMSALARLLVDFGARAPRTAAARHGSAAAVKEMVVGGFRECTSFIGDTLTKDEYVAIDRFNERFIERNRVFLDERAAGGFVREGHGDLRAEHIYLFQDHIDIVDCVEFSEAMRCALGRNAAN